MPAAFSAEAAAPDAASLADACTLLKPSDALETVCEAVSLALEATSDVVEAFLNCVRRTMNRGDRRAIALETGAADMFVVALEKASIARNWSRIRG